MSKGTLQLKEAIQGLNIKKPFDLRAQNKPALKKPVDAIPVQIEHAKFEYAKIENTQIEETESYKGFFMLAHSVFENELVRALSGDAFRIFVWMSAIAWRFKNSKGEFRASVDYVSMKCGCSRSTATRGLQDLKSKNLIVCIEQNFKKGNLWRVSRLADGRSLDTESEPAQNQSSQNEGGAGSNSACSLVKSTIEPAQNEHHLISSNKPNNQNNSLSTQDALDKYLLNLSAPKKRESESLSLKELLKENSREDILKAFLYLESKKFQFNGESVHSPIGFLNYALGQVLFVTSKMPGTRENPSNAKLPRQMSTEEVVTGARELKEEQDLLLAQFCHEFPEEEERREKLIQLLGERSLFTPDSELGKMFAVNKWKNERAS